MCMFSCFPLGKTLIMASSSSAKISYQRLRNEGLEMDDVEERQRERRKNVVRRVRSWSTRYRRVHIRRKIKIKIPSLRKFLRKKSKVIVASLAKVVKRLKESQAHFGDLFAGNYLFMQISPTSLKYLDKSSKNTSHLHHFSSTYYLPNKVY